MMEFLQNFHFLRPWMLLFLILPFGCLFKDFKLGQKVSSWENICDKNLLKVLLVQTESYKRISVKKFLYIGFISAVLAVAGPTWKKIEVPTLDVENPIMFVQSLSEDMLLTDIKPSRLDRAKFFISDISNNLEQGQFGMEVYSDEPFLVTPITDDIDLIKNILPQISPYIMPNQGDRPDRAIRFALERFRDAGYSQGNIILFASDVGQRFDLAIQVVQNAAAQKFNTHVVDTSYDGNDKLEIIAKKGNGMYLRVTDTNISGLLNVLTNLTDKKQKLNQNLRENYVDFGYYLLFIPLICMLIFFRKGLLVLAICIFSQNAYADFWQNNNQKGLEFFNKNLYEQALQKFEDPLWRGISLYKLNKNEEALKEFSKISTADALYNKGVVQIKLCKYADALKTFEKVIELDENNQDAVYNKNVLVDLFEKAKSDPKVLDCNQNQQKNKDNSQKQQNQQDKKEKQNQDKNKQDQNQNNNPNQEKEEKSEDKPQEQKQQNRQQQEKDEKNNNQSDEKQDNTQKENDAADDKDSSENGEKQDTSSEANSDNGEENKTKNEDGEEENGTEEQMGKAPVNLINVKKGDEDEKYDEEAQIIRRQYRKIPEEVGGLLKQFIEKEYRKGRYSNENM